MVNDRKKIIIKNILILIALLYSISVTTAALITKSSLAMGIHGYVTAIVSFLIAFKVMRTAIRTHDKGRLLYIVLGICCLALGNLYFFLLGIVGIVPSIISVGLFAKICCYLFFIAALLEFKKEAGKRSSFYFILINSITFILTMACAYSVLANSIYVLNSSVLLMDLFCLVLAFGLLPNKNARFFACLMLVIAVFDIISAIQIFAFTGVLIKSLSPLLYLLFARLLDLMEEGDAHVF